MTQSSTPGCIRCPFCNKIFKWAQHFAGKKAKCTCGHIIQMPTSPPATNQTVTAYQALPSLIGTTAQATSPHELSKTGFIVPQSQEPRFSRAIPLLSADRLHITHKLSIALSILLGVMIFISILNMLMNILAYTSYTHLFVNDSADPTDDEMLYFLSILGLSALNICVFIATVVITTIWMYKTNKWARSLGTLNMDFTPGWCVGWWFIPIANLYKPYRAMKELWQVSDPQYGADRWQNATITGIMSLWWTTWILANILGRLASKLYNSSRSTYTEIRVASVLDIISDVILIFAAVCLIYLVRRITKRMNEKAAQMSHAHPMASKHPNYTF